MPRQPLLYHNADKVVETIDDKAREDESVDHTTTEKVVKNKFMEAEADYADTAN